MGHGLNLITLELLHTVDIIAQRADGADTDIDFISVSIFGE
jgi:hypothetical protein